MLKRAKFRCELCAISAEEKALEVDHIIPRNAGGADDESNLQALCCSCNTMKRDRDDTDFRAIKESCDKRESGCLFCEIPKARIVDENALVYATPLFPNATQIRTSSWLKQRSTGVQSCWIHSGRLFRQKTETLLVSILASTTVR